MAPKDGGFWKPLTFATEEISVLNVFGRFQSEVCQTHGVPVSSGACASDNDRLMMNADKGCNVSEMSTQSVSEQLEDKHWNKRNLLRHWL